MAKIQHLYTGFGDPNDNPELVLTGDAVGNHLYSDLENSSAWMALSKADGEGVVHNRWVRLNKGDGPDLTVTAVMQVSEIGDLEFGQIDLPVSKGMFSKISWEQWYEQFHIKVEFEAAGFLFGTSTIESVAVLTLGEKVFERQFYGGASHSQITFHIDQEDYDALPRSGELAVKVEYW